MNGAEGGKRRRGWTGRGGKVWNAAGKSCDPAGEEHCFPGEPPAMQKSQDALRQAADIPAADLFGQASARTAER